MDEKMDFMPKSKSISTVESSETIKEDYSVKRSKGSDFKSYSVKVATAALNIRKGAGMKHDIVGMITDKGVYVITEVSADKKWGKLKSGEGWICLDYTKKI